MSKLSDLKKELRDLRKQHCPPTGKMKKDDVQKEIERLRGVEKVTEYEAPAPKPRAKKAKVEKKEMAVQADMDEEEEEDRREAMAKRMAEVRARRKIAGAVTKAVEAKKEKKATEEKVETMKKKVAGRKVAEAVKKMVEGKKAKKEREMMAEEDMDVGKAKRRKLRGERVTKEVTKIEEKPATKKKPESREERNRREELAAHEEFKKKECNEAIQTIEKLKEDERPFKSIPKERELYYKMVRKLQEFCEKNKKILVSPYNSIDDLPPVMRKGFAKWAKENKFSFD